MRKLFFLSFLIFFILFGCSKDSTEIPESDSENPFEEETIEEPLAPKNEVYFTLNVSENFIPEGTEEWVIIHDENGILLDQKMVTNSNSTIFETLSTKMPKTYTVTRFRHILFSSGTSRFFIHTYPDNSIGDVWNYKYNNEPIKTEVSSDIIGSFSIKVNNIPPPYHFSLSALEVFNAYSSYLDLSYTNHLQLLDIPLRETNNYMLSIIDGNNTLKYRYLENVLNNELLTLDYNQFLDFDHYVTIDLPYQNIDYTYIINGLAEDVDYPGNYGFEYQSNDLHFDAPPYRSQLNLGYLDRFAKNKTWFGITMEDDNYVYRYYKQGERPIDIKIPEKPNYSISGNTVYDFSFSASSNYNYSLTNWRAEEKTGDIAPEFGGRNPDITDWTIYANYGRNPKVAEFPEELAIKFPNLNLEALEYKSTTLYINSESYANFITSSFVTNTSKNNSEFEEEVITIYK